MRVFNADKSIELKEYDLNLGYLIDDEIVTHHEAEIINHEAEIIHHEAEIINHEAVEGVEEQGHYEVIAEYPETGGKDVRWIVDVPRVEAREAYTEVVKEAYDDVENIQIYIPYTEKEVLENEKRKLEQWLKDHDYIGTKIATGRATILDYQEEILLMTEKANRINEIDSLLTTM